MTSIVIYNHGFNVFSLLGLLGLPPGAIPLSNKAFSCDFVKVILCSPVTSSLVAKPCSSSALLPLGLQLVCLITLQIIAEMKMVSHFISMSDFSSPVVVLNCAVRPEDMT